MKHLWRTVSVAVAVVIAAVPMIIADPSVAHYIAVHPWAAAYLPLIAGILHAIYKAAKGSGATTANTGGSAESRN